MSTIAQPIQDGSLVSWRLPVVFIFITHIFAPLLMLWSAPSALRFPGGWVGAALLTSELLALMMTSFIIAKRCSIEPGVETALIALTLFVCLPSVVVTYLGFMGGLSLASMLVATGASEIGLLTLIRQDEYARFAPPAGQHLGFTFLERFLLALSILAFAIMALNAIRYTPADSDTMWYHLPMLAEWIKTKSIAPVASIPLMARGYPGARETILIWLSLPMTSENLAFLSLLEVPGTCLVVYAICREFDISKSLSLAAAAIFATTPEISLWSGSQKNDLFLTLAFLLVFFFMMRWLWSGASRYALLAGVSTGLLCATKLSGPVYAGTLAAMLLGTLVLRRTSDRPAASLRSIGLMSIAGAVVAAPWYIRNVEYFRNPVFPKEILVLGRVLFAGPLGASFFSPVTLGFDFPRLFANWRQFCVELGVALPVLVFTPILLLVLYCCRDRWRTKSENLLWLAALPMLLLAVYMVQPFSLLPRGGNSWEVQPRFLLPFLACLLVTLGYLLSRIDGAERFGLPVMALVSLGNIAFWTHFWWLLCVLALLAAVTMPLAENAASVVAGFAPRRYWPVVVIVIFIAATATSHWLDGFRERRKDSAEYGYIGGISPGWGRASLYVRHNIFNKRLLCLGRSEDFPLYGRGYTNDLYTADPTYAMELIRKNHIDYVVGFRPFVRHGSEGETWEYLPAATKDLRERHPEKFQLVYSADGAEIVKVLE